MAKKNPTDLSVEEKLKTLYQSQITPSGIGEKRTLRGELPFEVQDLEDGVVSLITRVERIKTDTGEFKKAITQKKADIIGVESSVERYRRQLDGVKNNHKYDTLTKEIELQNLEIQLYNKRIKEALIKVEEKNVDLTGAGELIKDRMATLEEKKEELDDIMQEARDEKGKLKNKASEPEVTIEPRLFLSFKRIRRNPRNGLGIIYVQRDAYDGRSNKIPPQRQLDIEMHKEVTVREYCGRIMIDPELAGVKVEKNATREKPKRRCAVRKTAKKDEEDKQIASKKHPEQR